VQVRKRIRIARSGACAALVCALCSAHVARAQDRTGAAGAERAPPRDANAPDISVVVTASRGNATLEEMPLHTTVITRQDILDTPALTLDQLLRQIPGVNLSGAPFFTTDPTGNQVRMRGVSNSKVLVLLDGIPMLDPFYTTVQWFKVPLSSIDHVEVIRGGNSSLWGNLATAGVINIVTRKPETNAGEIDASYGTQKTWTGAIAQDVVLSPAVSLALSADALDTNGYQTTPDAFLSAFPGKGPSSADIANARVAAYFTPWTGLTGFARAGYHRQDQDIGGYTFGTNLQKGPDFASGVTQRFDERSRVQANLWYQYLAFDKQNGAGCYLQAPAICNTTATTAPLVQYANSQDWNPYRELGGSVVYSMEFQPLRTSLQLGVDYRKVWGSDFATTYNRPTTTDAASASINRTNFGQGTQRFTGAFAQIRVVPLDPLEVTLSGRFDHWSNTDGVAMMTPYSNGVPQATTGGPIDDSSKSSFDPTLAARWTITRDLDLRGAAYKSFRAPGLNNLYRSFSSATSITIANPFLTPETLTGGEIGADYRHRGVEVNATAFIYNIRNLIASFRVPNAAAAPPQVVAICGPTLSNCPATVNFNTNAQDGRSYGVELVGHWNLSAALKLNGSYTHTRSYYTRSSVGDPIGAQLGAVPPNVYTAGVAWQPGDVWRLYAEVRYSSSMYLDVGHTIPQPGFSVVNATSTWGVTPDLDIYVSGVNLFDKHYVDSATTNAASSTLGAPRTVMAGFRWRFQ
jgi:iron complex outermembrane receptor protein